MSSIVTFQIGRLFNTSIHVSTDYVLLWTCITSQSLRCTCSQSGTFIFHFTCTHGYNLQEMFWMKKWSGAAPTCLCVCIISWRAGGLVWCSENGNDPWKMLRRPSAYSLATGPAVSNYTLCGGKFPFQVPFLGTTWAINFVMANRTADVLCARLGCRISNQDKQDKLIPVSGDEMESYFFCYTYN